MSAGKAQDLPPAGGYEKIRFVRMPAKTLFSGVQLFAGWAAITGISTYLVYLTYRQLKREEVETRSSKLAIYPLLVAERDREYLKQIRRNRDEETELMKNVPGWVVGTYFGEPIFKTKPKDFLNEGTWDELNVHATNWNRWKRNEHHNFN